VYDLLGREAALLVNEQKPAGTFSVELNASRLSSGLYYYTLEAGRYVSTKKLVLIR
jgi:hypothetical protein